MFLLVVEMPRPLQRLSRCLALPVLVAIVALSDFRADAVVVESSQSHLRLLRAGHSSHGKSRAGIRRGSHTASAVAPAGKDSNQTSKKEATAKTVSWIAPEEPPLGVVGDVVSSYLYGDNNDFGVDQQAQASPLQSSGPSVIIVGEDTPAFSRDGEEAVSYATVSRANASSGGGGVSLVSRSGPTLFLGHAGDTDCGQASSPCEIDQRDDEEEQDGGSADDDDDDNDAHSNGESNDDKSESEDSADDWDKKFETTTALPDLHRETQGANHEFLAVTLTAALADLDATLTILNSSKSLPKLTVANQKDTRVPSVRGLPSPAFPTANTSTKPVFRPPQAKMNFLEMTAGTAPTSRLHELVVTVEERARQVHYAAARQQALLLNAKQRMEQAEVLAKTHANELFDDAPRRANDEKRADVAVADTDTAAYKKLSMLVQELEKVSPEQQMFRMHVCVCACVFMFPTKGMCQLFAPLL